MRSSNTFGLYFVLRPINSYLEEARAKLVSHYQQLILSALK